MAVVAIVGGLAACEKEKAPTDLSGGCAASGASRSVRSPFCFYPCPSFLQREAERFGLSRMRDFNSADLPAVSLDGIGSCFREGQCHHAFVGGTVSVADGEGDAYVSAGSTGSIVRARCKGSLPLHCRQYRGC